MIHGSHSAACRYIVGPALLLAVGLLPLVGCRSEYHRQVEQAKATAGRTGLAQEVVSVDAGGRTTVTVVQPTGATATVHTATTTAGAPLAVGQPDWSNGARPSPGNTVTFSGPPMAVVAPVAAPVPAGTAATQRKPYSASAVVVPTDVVVPAGSSLAIRMSETISAKSNHAGDHFSGELADGVMEGGRTVLPRGTRVNGIVTEAHRRGRFKGQSTLGLRLTSIAYGNKIYPLATASLYRGKKVKRRAAVSAGAGAGVGAQVRSLATGGVGLAMSGLSGLGTLVAGVTGHRDLRIPAESLVRFRLEDNLTVQPAE